MLLKTAYLPSKILWEWLSFPPWKLSFHLLTCGEKALLLATWVVFVLLLCRSPGCGGEGRVEQDRVLLLPEEKWENTSLVPIKDLNIWDYITYQVLRALDYYHFMSQLVFIVKVCEPSLPCFKTRWMRLAWLSLIYLWSFHLDCVHGNKRS